MWEGARGVCLHMAHSPVGPFYLMGSAHNSSKTLLVAISILELC